MLGRSVWFSYDAALAARVSILEKEFAKMLKEQDDLAAAVAALTTAVSATATEISELVAKVVGAVQPTGVDPAAAEAAAVAIGALATKLNDSVSAANAAMAAPAPTPTP